MKKQRTNTRDAKAAGRYLRGDLTARIILECEAGLLQTASAMAKRLGEDPATVSGILARLVKQGRVVRTWATAYDVQQYPETIGRIGAWVY